MWHKVQTTACYDVVDVFIDSGIIVEAGNLSYIKQSTYNLSYGSSRGGWTLKKAFCNIEKIIWKLNWQEKK